VIEAPPATAEAAEPSVIVNVAPAESPDQLQPTDPNDTAPSTFNYLTVILALSGVITAIAAFFKNNAGTPAKELPGKLAQDFNFNEALKDASATVPADLAHKAFDQLERAEQRGQQAVEMLATVTTAVTGALSLFAAIKDAIDGKVDPPATP